MHFRSSLSVSLSTHKVVHSCGSPSTKSVIYLMRLLMCLCGDLPALLGFPAFSYDFPYVLSYTPPLAFPAVFPTSSQLALFPILKVRVTDAFLDFVICSPTTCFAYIHLAMLFRASPRVPLGFLVGSLWRSLCIGRGSLTRFPVLYTMRSLRSRDFLGTKKEKKI